MDDSSPKKTDQNIAKLVEGGISTPTFRRRYAELSAAMSSRERFTKKLNITENCTLRRLKINFSEYLSAYK